MATATAYCPHGHAPTASNSERRFYAENCAKSIRLQLTCHLQSESSHCGSREDGEEVPMVVEVRTILRVNITVPSPEQGRSYLLAVSEVPSARSLPIYGADLAQRFSSPDATLETLAPLFSSRPLPRSKLDQLLREIVGSFARATVASAGIAGEKGPIRVLADVECFVVLGYQAVLEHVPDRPMINAESPTLGTCAVCLEEIKQRWLRTLRLPCSHVFHFYCITSWLHRKNSCPVCRLPLQLIRDGDPVV